MRKIIFIFLLMISSLVNSQDLSKYNQVRNINYKVAMGSVDFNEIQRSFDKQEDKKNGFLLLNIYESVYLKLGQLEIIYFMSDLVSKEKRDDRDKFTLLYFQNIKQSLNTDLSELNHLIGQSNNYTIKKNSEELKSEIRKIQSVMNQ
jgi:hypothetical protein